MKITVYDAMMDELLMHVFLSILGALSTLTCVSLVIAINIDRFLINMDRRFIQEFKRNSYERDKIHIRCTGDQ